MSDKVIRFENYIENINRLLGGITRVYLSVKDFDASLCFYSKGLESYAGLLEDMVTLCEHLIDTISGMKKSRDEGNLEPKVLSDSFI